MLKVLLAGKFKYLYRTTVHRQISCSRLKVMKRADSCKHGQAVKNVQCEKKLFKSHLYSSKLGKRVEKHATSTSQKIAASMENGGG